MALAALIILAGMSPLFPHPENFAPFTAIAVFAGVTFASGRAALIAPLLAIVLKDIVLEFMYRAGLTQSYGFYTEMWVIYGALALVALVGRLARGTRSPMVIAAATLTGSCLFFLITNLAVWASGGIYPRTMVGLMECYTAAIPFFRNSLFGDCCYSFV